MWAKYKWWVLGHLMANNEAMASSANHVSTWKPNETQDQGTEIQLNRKSLRRLGHNCLTVGVPHYCCDGKNCSYCPAYCSTPGIEDCKGKENDPSPLCTINKTTCTYAIKSSYTRTFTFRKNTGT